MSQEFGCHHTITQRGREVPGALDDSLAVISWHLCIGGSRGGRVRGLSDVHQGSLGLACIGRSPRTALNCTVAAFHHSTAKFQPSWWHPRHLRPSAPPRALRCRPSSLWERTPWAVVTPALRNLRLSVLGSCFACFVDPQEHFTSAAYVACAKGLLLSRLRRALFRRPRPPSSRFPFSRRLSARPRSM